MKILRLDKRFFLILLLCCTVARTTFSQPLSSRFSYEKYVDNQDTLLYRLLLPDYNPLGKYPLVIFMHGAGERGNDNESQLKWGVQNFATDEMIKLHPSIVIVPQCPLNEGWSDFSDTKSGHITLQPSATKSMKLVIALIHQIIKKFSIDTNRIYITGLSMGGYGTYDAIERYPDLFAAAVPVCGGGDVSKAPVISLIPIWIFHGSDDPVVNPDFSLNMTEALRKAGAHPALTMYPETGHFAWIAAYSDVMMINWLFGQHK